MELSLNVKRTIVLILLTLQLTSLTLFLRYSRGNLKEDYSFKVVLFFSETIKFIVSSVITFMDQSKTSSSKKESIMHYLSIIKHSYVFLPPALMYVINNTLQPISLKHINAPVFTVLNQLKILATALFSVIILKRSISLKKWISLFILCAGVVLVNTQQYFKFENNTLKFVGMVENENDQKTVFGIVIAIVIVFISALAGIYIELFLKKKTQNLTIWDRNVQLALLSMISFFIFKFVSEDCKTGYLSSECYFGKKGFSFNIIILILLKAGGGLLVAFVVKISNNVVKGFSVSFAIVLSTLYSWFFWDFDVNIVFVAGASFVVFSLFMYTLG